ncbi:MAG: hypothetical protein GWP37_03175 [Gammaproteobacteria bacterium]|nr:hypothetical protein [Gammaproteobacteria bacterium]
MNYLVRRGSILDLVTIWVITLISLLASQSHADTQWRVAPDLIFKSQWLSSAEPSPGYWASAGIDAYRTFNLNGRSFATATVQLYEWCVEDRLRKPGVLKGTSDCTLVSKVSKLNFLASGDGKFNIMIGHTELPFGLEVPVATNETLRSLLTPRDTGLKLDWGTGVNGTIDGVAYEFTLTRGSGFEWESESVDKRSPWAFAGRVGTATDRQAFLPSSGHGVSVFKGEVLNPQGGLSERWRIAYDRIGYRGALGYMIQLSHGKIDDRDVTNAFLEINTNSPDERWVSYAQIKSFNEEFATGWERSQTWAVGIRTHLTPKIIGSAQIAREPKKFFDQPEQTVFDLQLRLRLE